MDERKDGIYDDALKGCIREISLDPHGRLFPQEAHGIDAKTLSESYLRLQTIYALGREICGTIEVERLLEAIIDAIRRLVPLERCLVASVDPPGKVKILRSHNIEAGGDFDFWPVSRSIISKSLREGVSILSSDAIHDDRFSNIDSVNVQNIRSVICVPLGPGGSSTGVIYADSRVKCGCFSELDLYFLTALSHYIDVAVRNAKKLEEVKNQCRLSDERSEALQQELLGQHRIVGSSRILIKAYESLKRAAAKEIPILLAGETGTGKELFAKATHKLSRRSRKTFMPLNIAELSEAIIESELFGHEKGSFSGATAARRGRLEMSDEGTLFLDEVAEIPVHIQAKLLRVLETGDFMRVGGTRWIHTDVRLVCATNKDLETLVKEGKFREDLYFRLKGATIRIPPLRDRKGDIPELIGFYLKVTKSERSFTQAAVECMVNYAWPGNVRQLIHFVQEMEAVCESEVIDSSDLPEYIRKSVRDDAPLTTDFPPLPCLLAQVEEKHFRKALALSNGNNEEAIRKLGISRATFFERKKRYRL